ncbi:hypothetical protein OJAV_G00210140 [Oryzias javanicus]|uniref:Uncharacterized protein n=1 Tax=Oryzias javanicus TaxID=123683 RepID=A0A3S2MFW2_ORYJA|nr:hypothetical protein OJAV_G00210140 [Oryzias javanicus]
MTSRLRLAGAFSLKRHSGSLNGEGVEGAERCSISVSAGFKYAGNIDPERGENRSRNRHQDRERSAVVVSCTAFLQLQRWRMA